jgi:hypothetical protein
MQRGTRQQTLNPLLASLCGVTDLHKKMPSNAFFTIFGILVSWLERTPNRSECVVNIQCNVFCCSNIEVLASDLTGDVGSCVVFCMQRPSDGPIPVQGIPLNISTNMVPKPKKQGHWSTLGPYKKNKNNTILKIYRITFHISLYIFVRYIYVHWSPAQ